MKCEIHGLEYEYNIESECLGEYCCPQCKIVLISIVSNRSINSTLEVQP